MRTRCLARIVYLQVGAQTSADAEMDIRYWRIQKKGQLDCVRVPGVEIGQAHEQRNLASRRDYVPKSPPT